MFCITIIFLFISCPLCLSTCIVALCSLDGILLGADTQGSNGNLINNRETNKIFQIGPKEIICCVSNENGFQDLCHELASHCRLHKLHSSTIGYTALKGFIRKRIHSQYSTCHVILACVENSVQKLCEILPGGSCIEQDFVVAGTSSNQLYPLLSELLSTESKDRDDVVSSSLKTSEHVPLLQSSEPITAIDALIPPPPQPLIKQSRIPSSLALRHVKKILRAASHYDPRSGGHAQLYFLSSRRGFHTLPMTGGDNIPKYQ